MWRVIWTPLGGTFPDHTDWHARRDAELFAAGLTLAGIADATIHNLGDNE